MNLILAEALLRELSKHRLNNPFTLDKTNQIIKISREVFKAELTSNELLAKNLLFQLDQEITIANMHTVVEVLESNSVKKDHDICKALGIVKKYNRAFIKRFIKSYQKK